MNDTTQPLSATQQRTMEILAKFYRLNPEKALAQGRGNATLNMGTLKTLEQMGLVVTYMGHVSRVFRVYLTEEGQQVACGICFDQGVAGHDL